MGTPDSILSPQTKALGWPDWLIAAAIFAAAMTLYVRTLATSLLLGDSGEYQVLYNTLGLAHPTGYAVLIPLAKLISLLVPVGDAAYRGNLVSAIFAGLTLALLYLLGRVLSGRRLAPLAGVTALGLYRLFWWHAIMAESITAGAAMIPHTCCWATRQRDQDPAPRDQKAATSEGTGEEVVLLIGHTVLRNRAIGYQLLNDH